MQDTDAALRALIPNLTDEEISTLIQDLPSTVAAALLDEFGATRRVLDLPVSPLEQALTLNPSYAIRPHLAYLDERIAKAVGDVESGVARKLIIEMPPRSGKSEMASKTAPAWILSTHPSWPIVLTSYSSALAEGWSRDILGWAGEGLLGDHISVRPGAATAARWETNEHATIVARSIGSGTTGFGAKVLVIDDPHKDFSEAHSPTQRDRVWNWYLSVSNTRLHPPALTIVVMTRWHEDDLIGRLLSREYPGEPSDWEVIRIPAIAEENDVLGREVGDPLFSPLADETREQALERWEQVKRDSGSYVWNALYQQRPSPAEGAIFSMDSWRYWTTDPALADGERVVLLPAEQLANGTWLDSWDCAFKATSTSDYVAGQRWVRVGADRFLIAQRRDRWTFTDTQAQMLDWADSSDPAASPYGHLVHKRLVEDAANGPAILDSLKRLIPGLKAVKADKSKEARARAVTPEIESGNVFLPFPAQPGHEWVNEYLSEFRNFPNDAHDDQVDATTQALLHLRDDQSAILHPPTPRRQSLTPFGGGLTSARMGGRVMR